MTTIFHLPTKIIFGTGTVSRLGAEASALGKRAMLVTGGHSARKTGLLDKVTRDLKGKGLEVFVFDKVSPNPRPSTVDEAAQIVRQKKLDLIIGLGGGSVMDAAKAIKLASAGNKPIWDYYLGLPDAKVTEPLIPLILVPTVAATGSEADYFSVLTKWDVHEKRALLSPYYFPNVSIVDPELTLTVPAKTTAQGGLDMFLHVAEPYISTANPSPTSDGIMETIMKVAVDALPQALTRLDDLEARTNLSWSSTLACSQIPNLGGGTGYKPLHLIEHPVSGYYDIAHGDGLAALLPAWMKHTYPVRKDRFASLGKNVFGEADGIVAVEKWMDSVGMKLDLRTLGVDPRSFKDMADCAMETSRGLLAKDPLYPDTSAIVQIYKDSY